VASPKIHPEARPSGIMRSVQERKKQAEIATVYLAILVGVIVATAAWFALG
jgi:hypothetical protein